MIINNELYKEILLSDSRIFAYLSSNRTFKIYPHIDLIFQKLNDVINNKIKNLLIEMPPRHGKTESIIYFLSYYFKKYNNKQVIYCTYSAELSHEKARKIRDIINNTAGDKVSKDYSAMRRFETENKNILVATGVFGSITGRGANLLIIDDIIKNQEEAKNPKYMSKIFDYFKYVLYTRLLRESHIVIINTRWSKNDFSNFIRENYKDFEILSLPAISEENKPLCEKLFNLERLEQIKKDIGIDAFMSLYQQQPIDETTNYFDSKYFKYFILENEGIKTQENKIYLYQNLNIFFVIDTASTISRTSDYFALLVCAINEFNDLFVIDFYKNKIEFTEHEAVIYRYSNIYKPKFILIEEYFVGIALFQNLKKKGLPVKSIKSKENKILRAENAKIYYENGKIYHNKNIKNLYEFEQEILLFPNAKHDDLVDCLSYACKYVRENSFKSSIFSAGKI
jgi:predicted phage terminase large subunit-like protein